MSLDKAQALNAAKQHVLQRNVQAAVDIYEKVIKDDPSDLTVSSTLGDLYVSTGQVQQAIAQLSRVADAYMEHGQARKAIATLKKIIAIDPTNAATAIKLADLYARAGLPSEARQHYLQIADALTRKGSTLDALNVFRKVVQLDPSNTSTRIKLGELFLREGMNDQAYEAFMTAAEQLSGKLEYKRALNAYNEALAIKPGSSDAVAASRKLMTVLGIAEPEKTPHNLGSQPETSRVASENSARPVAHPSTPVERIPGSESFVVQEISKAEILVAYGKVNQALSMLTQVLKSNPDSIDVHIKLKDIYLRTGMMTEAAHECSALERIFEARGDSERARDYAIRASRLTQLLEQPSGDLPEPRRKPAEEVAPRTSSAPPEPAPEQATAPKSWPIITTAPLTAPPRPNAPRPRPVLSAPPLQTRPQKDTASKPRPVSGSSPIQTTPQRNSAPKPQHVVSSAPPKAAPQPNLAPTPLPITVEADAGVLQPNPVTSSPSTSHPPAVTLPTMSAAGSVLEHPLEGPALMVDANLAILPANQSALAEVNPNAPGLRERSLPLMLGGPLDKSNRGGLTATGLAAGALILISAIIGGFAYDAHLDKQYAELALVAPPLETPQPPPVVREEGEGEQESESITVIATPSPDTDVPAPRQIPEPKAVKVEQPAPLRPAKEPPRTKAQTLPMPPRAIASPDVRAGNEIQTPAGLPNAVPVGAANPPEPPPRVLRQSPGVVLGGAITKVDPGYPAAAKQARQSGTVAVEVTISEQGNVTSARALSGPMLLRNAAVAAARAWKFRPSTLGGVPVTTNTTIVFNFKL